MQEELLFEHRTKQEHGNTQTITLLERTPWRESEEIFLINDAIEFKDGSRSGITIALTRDELIALARFVTENISEEK